MHIEGEDADGPPPPPHVRRRRRRRNTLLITAGLIIAGVPLVLGVISNTDTPVPEDETAGASDDQDGEGDAGAGDDTDDPGEDADEPGGSDDAGDADGPGDGGGTDGSDDAGDADPLEGERLERPEPDELDGSDALYAQLLVDIDTAELAMIGFQDALSRAFEEGGIAEQDELAEMIHDAAAEGQDELAAARTRLAEPLDVAAADEVREVYLEHLEAWVSYLGAIEEDPGLLGAEERARTYLLSINVTADGFARTLEQELPDDLDGEVRSFAEELLDRGFRDSGDANV